MITVTCNTCGWVSVGVSREYAEREVKAFNDYFDKQNDDVRQAYGNRRASINNYVCLCCGRLDFRLAEKGDCPDGVTLNPVIYAPTS